MRHCNDMSFQASGSNDARSAEETAIRALYQQLLEAWNARSGETFAAAFAEDGEIIGFDGSQHVGRPAIAADLGKIFADHSTPTYVAKVRGVRFLAPGVALLRAVAGLVPRGQSDLMPQLNALQTMLATRRDGEWRIVLFQNTPAQFHGRPELVEQLTEELRQVLAKGD
jgi:uncharacterized protein (TIGR02246 family)